jgi:16S rRNA processing protein RimM
VPATTGPGPDPADHERIVVLGRLVGSFGVAGWVKVSSYTDPVDNVLDYPVWRVGGPGAWQPYRVEEGKVTAKGVLARLDGVDSREQAQEMNGALLGVLRSELPAASPGEYYWSDLEGLEAVTPAGEVLGRVNHFRTTPAHPLIVITGGERQHLVPFVRERILSVDLAAGRVVLDWGSDW